MSAAPYFSASPGKAHDGGGHRWLGLYSPGTPAEIVDAAESPLEAFDKSLETAPDAPALWYFETSLTFRQVDQLADALAAAWAGRVEPGERIAILNQNTPATVIGLVAAWRLGAIVMPLNPMLKRRELVHYLSDGKPAAVLVGAEQALALQGAMSDWGEAPATVVTYSRDFLGSQDAPKPLQGLVESFVEPQNWSRLSEILLNRGAPPARRVIGSDVALLTYTSGTTGKPKAALNTHSNVAFSAEVYRRWMNLGSDDVLFAAAPFSHVTGLVAHIAAGFASGAPVVMCYRFEPGAVLDLLMSRGCTSMVAAITAYIALLDHPSFDASRLARLQKVFSGGAPVAPAVVERWEVATGVYIHNAYGMTETTSPSHLVPFGRRAPVDEQTGALSIGVPVPGTHCRVVDNDTRAELPFGGAVGELMIRGPQVVAGYWCRPKESSESFEDGWLRTGDLGRVDEQGWFYVVDRSKDMIVASGFKVWPREVEDVLHEHASVSEAAVVGVPDSYRGEAPKAFVVARAGLHIDVQELTAFCREHLAAYKVPRLIEVVDELPKTNSGKVLRRLLRERSL